MQTIEGGHTDAVLALLVLPDGKTLVDFSFVVCARHW
jgi:hypothetical protein